MKKVILTYLTFYIFLQVQGQSIAWEKNFGGTETDYASSVLVDYNAVYLASNSNSDDNGFSNLGGTDIVITKMDLSGELIWSKNFGGSGDDNPYKILKSADGNLIVVGSSDSNDGIFSNNKGGVDGFVLKVSSQGDLLWAEQFGGSDGDFLLSAFEAYDGNIYVSGVTESTDNGLGNHGLLDAWISRISTVGDLVWQKSYGGSYNDLFLDITGFSETLFILCGRTRSNDGDVTGFNGVPNNGFDNGWVVIINSSGQIYTQECMGNTMESDVGFNSLVKLSDDRIVVGGDRKEIIGDPSEGNYNFFIVEYSGTLGINQLYGDRGVEGDYTLSQIVMDSNENLYAVGTIATMDGSPSERNGSKDIYISKINKEFEEVWGSFLGTEGEDWSTSVAVDNSGGLVACGSKEVIDEGSNHNQDIYIVKLCPGYKSEISIGLCQGDSIEIDGQYVKEQGNYVDSLTAIDGCDSIVTYYLEVIPSFLFETSITGICNSEIELHDFIISESGNYTYPFKTVFGCDSTYVYAVEIDETNPGVTQNGNTITALQSGANYQWYNCETYLPIDGATMQSLSVKESGEYMVKIDFNGCLDESECVFVSGTSNRSESLQTLLVYPNPANSFIHIADDNNVFRSGRILDLMGVTRSEFECHGMKTEINISYLPSGIYLLQLKSNDAIITKEFIKK